MPFLLRATLIPLLTALTGWGVITLALRLIFHPRQPRRWAGLTLQGLLPGQRPALARALGRVARQQVAAREDLLAILERPEVRAGIDDAIQAKIADFLDNKLRAINPMLGMLLGGSLREKVEGLLAREVQRLVPELAGQLAAKFEENVDIGAIVEEKVLALDLDELERMMDREAAPALRSIKLAAAALGLAVGMVQVLLLL